MSRSVTAIVDTPEEAAQLELPPLLVRRPLEAFLDAHALGSGPIEAEPVGEGHSNVTYLIRRGDTELVLEIARRDVPEPEGIEDAQPAGVRHRSVQTRSTPQVQIWVSHD